jgi:hypothetical protein
MEYPEYLHPDSMDLVQRLLADLIQTTESSRTFKSQLDIAQSDKILAEEQVLIFNEGRTIASGTTASDGRE